MHKAETPLVSICCEQVEFVLYWTSNVTGAVRRVHRRCLGITAIDNSNIANENDRNKNNNIKQKLKISVGDGQAVVSTDSLWGRTTS